MERAGRLFGKFKIPANSISPEALACTAWAPAVGKKIAAHTAAVSLVRGSLLVEVEDKIWQRQLTTMKAQIVSRLQEVAGPDVVTDVAFRPMVPRKTPQRALSAARPSFALTADEADTIADPVFRRIYKTSRKRATA